jgi:hypothetical protein
MQSFKIKYNPILVHRISELFTIVSSEDVKNAAWDTVEVGLQYSQKQIEESMKSTDPKYTKIDVEIDAPMIILPL